MKGVLPIIMQRSRGFKAFAWGYADDHTMEWRGCNYRFKPIPDQPYQGWTLLEDAIKCLLRQFPTFDDLETWARGAGDGQFLTDAAFDKRVEVPIYEAKVRT